MGESLKPTGFNHTPRILSHLAATESHSKHYPDAKSRLSTLDSYERIMNDHRNYDQMEAHDLHKERLAQQIQ